MEGRLARWAPLGASLLGHAALAAALAAGLLVPRDAPREPVPIPVRRAADPPLPAGPALRLLAPAEADAVRGPAEGGAIPLDTADARYRPYLAGVQRRIWERWHAPEGAPATGALVVEFTLTRSGRVAATDVREQSGSPALDRAALAAIAGAAPFLPLPEAIAGDTLRVRARFVYD